MSGFSRNLSGIDALERLKVGNERYLTDNAFTGDVTESVRIHTALNGQSPYAVIITCSDSRVIPEAVFSASIGELFVIRVAGNVVGANELGSIEYAVDHLGCKLVVVLGHTGCGAVDATIHHPPQTDGYLHYLTDRIKLAIGDEKDALNACKMNVQKSVSDITQALKGQAGFKDHDVSVVGAIYDIKSGKVAFDIEL